ncbi:MAG: hypothetical protein KAI79_08145 [Bacteroidales bacterium]|nr:hypothetical protein [Bacteroidales bacterium]
MGNYNQDRQFSDYIHKNVAIAKIYDDLGWHELPLEASLAKKIDIDVGIDYVFVKKRYLITVQERFREIKYQNFSDFTIRYRRDNNIHKERVESEYYKLKADYFTYGITNCTKANIADCTDFVKFALIDLKKLYQKIDSDLIIFRDNKQNYCKLIDGNTRMECPIKYNKDGSSSFIPIDIVLLSKLWGNDLLIAQKGFL